MSFVNIIEKYRNMAFSEHDKGARFERLMQAYLQTDPKYAHLFHKVWLWPEFPYRAESTLARHRRSGGARNEKER